MRNAFLISRTNATVNAASLRVCRGAIGNSRHAGCWIGVSIPPIVTTTITVNEVEAPCNGPVVDSDVVVKDLARDVS